MEFNPNQTLTPEKIVLLIQEIRNELLLIREAIKTKQVGSEAYRILLAQSQRLQNLLDILLNKKGIMTPAETKSALELLNESKRARLEKQYYMGISRATWFLIGIGVIAVGTYVYLRKK